jgi:carbon-monoxide dehydrogenase medium subunit
VSDRPVSTDVSAGLQRVLARVGESPGEGPLRRELQPLAAELAEQVVDTGGDAHASQSYRKQLVTGLAAREIARAYLKSTRATPETP